MQEIGNIQKALSELEYLVAYQRHVITTSKCTCDHYMDSLREFYRIYMNMKMLTLRLRNSSAKMNAETARVVKQQQHQLQRSPHKKSFKKSARRSFRNKAECRILQNQNKAKSLNIRNQLGLSNTINSQSPINTDCLFEAQPIYLKNKSEIIAEPELSSDNLYNAQLISTVRNQMLFERIDHSKNDQDTEEEEDAKLLVSNSKSSSSLASVILIQSSPVTTTIAQAIEETEALIALRQKQMPFSYLYNATSANSELNQGKDLNHVHSVCDSAFSLMQATVDRPILTAQSERINEYDNDLIMKPTVIEIPNLCLTDSLSVSSSANSTLSTKSSLVSYKLTPNACSSPLDSANVISKSNRSVRCADQEKSGEELKECDLLTDNKSKNLLPASGSSSSSSNSDFKMDKLLTVADIHTHHQSLDYQYDSHQQQQQQQHKTRVRISDSTEHVNFSHSNAKTSAFRLIGVTNDNKVIGCSSSSTTSSSTSSSTNCNENEFILPACLNETNHQIFFNQQHPPQTPIDSHRPLVGAVCLSSSSSVQSASYSSSSSSSSSSSNSINLNQNVIQTKTNRLSNGCVPQEYEYIRDEECEKKRISKGRVIDELIQTEMDYYKVMKLLYDVYLSENSENTIDQQHKEAIFCNLQQIMNLSSNLLNDFELNILNKSFEEVKIGQCFIKNANLIRQTYAYYAQYIEYSNNILEKSEKVAEVQCFIQNGLNIIKQQTTSAFDLHSLLLKPIQRVLKYPLLLQELIKYTEVYHEDYQDLIQALNGMQDVATYINEIKRRRELIVKYSRKDKDQTSISEKMSKFTLHSMIKKSNRISMKLSSALRLNGISIHDEKFDKLEAKFRHLEKLIKCFSKDSIHHLGNLKEFFKAQTVTAESIQEFYAESQSETILRYVHINATVLNEVYTKNSNFVHEKVLQPLNSLVKYLEIPNKLITKRHDKLLDYECARSNVEKLKDKTLMKTVQENLYEAQKNYEALNNQLLEELPYLIEKCSTVMQKCFTLYLRALGDIHKRIRFQLFNLLFGQGSHKIEMNNCNNNNTNMMTNKTNKQQKQRVENEHISNRTSSSFHHHHLHHHHHHQNQQNNNTTNTNNNNNNQVLVERNTNLIDRTATSHQEQASKLNNMSDANQPKSAHLTRKESIMSNAPKTEGSRRKKLLFNNPVVQMIKKFNHGDDTNGNGNTSNNNSKPKNDSVSFSSTVSAQSESMRERLKKQYKLEDLFIVVKEYSGVGVTDTLALNVDDLVAVLKKADPCGNTMNWFVDNGVVKGIVSAAVLKPYSFTSNDNDELINCENSDLKDTFNSSFDDLSFTKNMDKSVNGDLDNSCVHNYVNSSNEFRESNAKCEEECIALYSFEAIDETTLSIDEGERLKIVQKHDDNMNQEWWLVERSQPASNNMIQKKHRGYVPFNYVEIIATSENFSKKGLLTNESVSINSSMNSHLTSAENQSALI